jgi:Tfp pilus assembly pilus retraction ATPase PilT
MWSRLPPELDPYAWVGVRAHHTYSVTVTTTVLIVDDHPGFRTALAALLRSEPDLEVVGSARDGVEAVELADRV